MKRIIASLFIMLSYWSYSKNSTYNESKNDSTHIFQQLDSLKLLVSNEGLSVNDLPNIIKIQNIYKKLNIDSALFYSDIEILLTVRTENENDIANARLKKAMLFQQLIKPDLAIELLQKNLNNRSVLTDTTIAKSLLILAKAEIQKKLPAESFKHGVAASEIFMTLNDSVNTSTSLSFLAGLQLFILEDLNKAIYYYEKAIAFNNNKNEMRLFSIYINYSTALVRLEKYEAAIQKVKKAELIAQKINLESFYASVFVQYSLIYNKTQEYKTSLKYALKADSTINSTINFDNRTKEKVIWYLAINYKALKEYDKAIDHFKLLKNSLLLDNWVIKSHLIDIYSETNKFKKAFLLQQKLIENKDSIDELQRTEKLKEVSEKYENEKSRQEIVSLNYEKEIQENQLKKQRFTLFGIVGFFILLLGFGRYWFKTRIKLKESAQNLEQKELQQRFLRTQLNPHFLFHALTSIENYIYTHDKEKAASFLRNFSKLMRNILEFSDMDFISLENDINFIEKYIGLQQLNYDFQFNYVVNVSESLNVKEIYVPPMLIQPVVENAILHGALSTEHGIIAIDYTKVGDEVEIKISDNGKILEKTAKYSNKLNRSMSMDITKKRIKNLKEVHDIKIEFNTAYHDDKNIKTAVLFKIPIKNSILKA